MYKDYSEEVVECLQVIDYDLVELEIINDYFREIIKGEKFDSSKAFYEKSTKEHSKYLNLIGEYTHKIKIKLEINNETKLLKEFDNILKANHSDRFITYNEDCNTKCLINYEILCNEYIDYMKKCRIWLIDFSRMH